MIGKEDSVMSGNAKASGNNSMRSNSTFTIPACNSPIYCHGPLLDAVQRSGLFGDSKRFVDMPTKKPEQTILAAFRRLDDPSDLGRLEQFVQENFYPAGYELRKVRPRDWHEGIRLIAAIPDPKVRELAATVHGKWRGLLRQSDHSHKRLCEGCVSSHLPLPHPFVVPGGRFREFYYWDSYWVVEGLMVSEMCETAAGVMGNLLEMVRRYGMVPNGSRVYYLNRSQPPMLPTMVLRYWKECGKKDDDAFLRMALPLIQREYDFWMRERSVQIGPSPDHLLNLYRAQMNQPRPESYREDKGLEGGGEDVWQNIASAAESGWDFSARWLRSPNNNQTFQMTALCTCDLVPVDLNAIMYRNEEILAELYAQLKDPAKSAEMREASERRINLIQRFLYDPPRHRWSDWDLKMKRPVNRSTYISDLTPLWYGAHRMSLTEISQLLGHHEDLIWKHPGGTPISIVESGQQWDFPNVWAPVQFQLVRLYADILHRPDLALRIAQRWIDSVYCGLESFGQIFEKYHADIVGYPGGGGEYVVQEGFGWSNGVTLWMLERFGQNLTVPTKCRQSAILKPPIDYYTKMTRDSTTVLNEKAPLETDLVCAMMIVFLLGWLLLVFFGQLIVQRTFQ